MDNKPFIPIYNDITEVIECIVTLNHAWKIARDDLGSSHGITKSLREQKSSWQTTLLRNFQKETYLKQDTETESGEELLSVRLISPISINGVIKNDAEHIPRRLADEFFTEEELTELLSKGKVHDFKL